MKKIKIGFSDGGNLFSWMIKKATDSDVSHSYIVFEENGVEMIFQASKMCVNYETYSRFKSHAKVVSEFSLEVNDEEWEQMKKMQLEDLGKPYSIKEILGFIWVLFFRIFNKVVENPFSEGDHAYICVDLTAEQVGLDIDGTMTPADFRGWCNRNQRFTKEM